MEHAAGRIAVLEHAAKRTLDEVTLEGKTNLQKRFGCNAVLAASWELRDGAHWVNVLVHTADGTTLTFTEPLKIFPSDECIASIALVT